MSGFYLWSMRRAPAILFGLAIAVWVGMLLYTWLDASEMMAMERGMSLPFASKVVFFLRLIAAPLAPASLLLFAAALLWRVDRWMAAKGAVE